MEVEGLGSHFRRELGSVVECFPLGRVGGLRPRREFRLLVGGELVVFGGSRTRMVLPVVPPPNFADTGTLVGLLVLLLGTRLRLFGGGLDPAPGFPCHTFRHTLGTGVGSRVGYGVVTPTWGDRWDAGRRGFRVWVAALRKV